MATVGLAAAFGATPAAALDAVPVRAVAARAAPAAPPSPGVRALLAWLEKSADNEGAPFAVIDKRRAHLWLFDAARRPLGSTPVLLGRARGDASVPGIGEKPLALITVAERTTPAGRFIVHPGRNAEGEDVFWVDYDAAVSMHRVRATNPAERRLQRLASPTAADNRISYGCINVPAAFYDARVRPLLGATRGIVYLLPERVPFDSLFTPAPAEAGSARTRPAAAPARPS